VLRQVDEDFELIATGCPDGHPQRRVGSGLLVSVAADMVPGQADADSVARRRYSLRAALRPPRGWGDRGGGAGEPSIIEWNRTGPLRDVHG